MLSTAQINQAILDKFLELDGNGHFPNAPKNDDELWEFIWLAYGVKIPRKVVTPGHRAPFDFVADVFFERVKNALAFASRSAGKTYAVAILNHIDMLFKPNCEIASAGAVRDQADKCFRYFGKFCQQPWFAKMAERFEDITGERFVQKDIKAETVFGNGARMEVVTGTEHGLRGPHPHKARIDEIDLIDWEVLQTGLSMAKSSHGIRGQNVFFSTRQQQDGSMQQMLDTAAEKGIEVYQWNVWEILERCPRRCVDDPLHGSCPIYAFCQGKAHKCDGFFPIDDFIDKVRVLDRTSFETEWLNSRPSKHKLVYGDFDHARHIMTPKRLRDLTGCDYPQLTWLKLSGLDFGSSPGHPFVYLKLAQIPNHHAWLIYYEYVAEQRLIRDHANAIKSSPFYTSSEAIFADWDAQDRIELRGCGVPTWAAMKGHDTVKMGIDYVASLLQGYLPLLRPALYVWHECTQTIKEFGTYQWRTLANGKPDRTGDPEKANDHCMDALRYALYSWKQRGLTKYRARTIPGI